MTDQLHGPPSRSPGAGPRSLPFRAKGWPNHPNTRVSAAARMMPASTTTTKITALPPSQAGYAYAFDKPVLVGLIRAYSYLTGRPGGREIPPGAITALIARNPPLRQAPKLALWKPVLYLSAHANAPRYRIHRPAGPRRRQPGGIRPRQLARDARRAAQCRCRHWFEAPWSGSPSLPSRQGRHPGTDGPHPMEPMRKPARPYSPSWPGPPATPAFFGLTFHNLAECRRASFRAGPSMASAKDRAPRHGLGCAPRPASPAADPARPLSDGAQPPANADRAVGLTERVTAPPTSWCHGHRPLEGRRAVARLMP